MSFIEETTFLGVQCDKTSCPAELRANVTLGDYFESRNQCIQQAKQRGWSFWAGRSQRCYCPLHGPVMPTTMRRMP